MKMRMCLEEIGERMKAAYDEAYALRDRLNVVYAEIERLEELEDNYEVWGEDGL
jgi:hypothetical protein